MKASCFHWLACIGLMLWGSIAVAQTPSTLQKITALAAEPAQVTLTHADDQQRLLISGKLADESFRDLSRAVKYVSANPAIAAVSDQGIISAKTVGQTTIQVAGPDGTLATVPVT